MAAVRACFVFLCTVWLAAVVDAGSVPARRAAPVGPATSGQVPCGNVKFQPRVVWMMWMQGEKHLMEEGPELNRLAYSTWRRLNPCWRVFLLTKDNIHRFLPDIMSPRFKRMPDVQSFSDLVRLKLLQKYGGAWVDISVIPMQPLDNWVDSVINESGFFTFKFTPESLGRTTVSWFLLVDRPNHPLVTAWANRFMRRYLQGPDNFAYFQVHYELTALYNEGHPGVKRVLDSMVEISQAAPHRYLNGGCCPKGTKILRPELTEQTHSFVYKRPRIDVDAYNKYIDWLILRDLATLSPSLWGDLARVANKRRQVFI